MQAGNFSLVDVICAQFLGFGFFWFFNVTMKTLPRGRALACQSCSDSSFSSSLSRQNPCYGPEKPHLVTSANLHLVLTEQHNSPVPCLWSLLNGLQVILWFNRFFLCSSFARMPALPGLWRNCNKCISLFFSIWRFYLLLIHAPGLLITQILVIYMYSTVGILKAIPLALFAEQICAEMGYFYYNVLFQFWPELLSMFCPNFLPAQNTLGDRQEVSRVILSCTARMAHQAVDVFIAEVVITCTILGYGE